MDVPFGRSGPGTPGLPGSNGQQRTKRMRTSFKHHQLRTMKSYFAINHNPDAKDLKQLSQKTGLPKRVLQVSDWGHRVALLNDIQFGFLNSHPPPISNTFISAVITFNCNFSYCIHFSSNVPD
jgi:hypothetical protein